VAAVAGADEQPDETISRITPTTVAISLALTS
jgi:hypothetical protein